MATTPLLRDYERKRARAMLHLDCLRKEVERVTNGEQKPVRGERQRDAPEYIFEVPLEQLGGNERPDIPLVLGDFAFNTRASLDYLITALVRSTGEKENEINQFPIYTFPKNVPMLEIHDWWDASPKVARQLEHTPAGTRAALKELQPFYGVPAANPFDHPLGALAVLSNRDKHRRLNLLAHVGRYEFIDADGKPIFQGPSFGTLGRQVTDSYEGETYTLRLTTDLEVDMYLKTAHDVALHEPPELIGDLIETLSGINEFIDFWVVPAVEALL